ncbi:hypothetical protein H0H81_007586 [Sphagnurus paluster]|uniref:RlpA-like protein double-psi beta-barrel domain-containing protein n=1 Tax=Sphagnurus paluster TaxID=117069 RepID=A0A9P7FR07_9AGAR|nr:hypothetical protein H0H81_007586 [Sphagnurus paluster]
MSPSSSLGLYTLFIACLTALFITPTLAAPISELVARAGFTGRATYFEVGLGSCGQSSANAEYIVALNPSTYASGSHCGQQIQITDPKSGVSATATVRDTCPGCGPNDLDMSPALFRAFAPLERGTFQMEWSFV